MGLNVKVGLGLLSAIKVFFVTVLAACTLLVQARVALYIVGVFPVNEPQFYCAGLNVHFDGPKSKPYIQGMIKYITAQGETYRVKGDHIYTTIQLADMDQQLTVIQSYVRPEWFAERPRFEDAKQERIVRAWRDQGWPYPSSEKKCHLIEAAISKNGIDIEARRNNPRIWPRDQFPIPGDQ